MPGALSEVVWDPKFQTYDFGPGRWAGGGPRSLSVHLMDGAGLFEDPTSSRWVRSCRTATWEDLRRFHDETYLARVERVSRRRSRVYLDSRDTLSFPGCFAAAARIAGGALEAFEAVRSGRTFRAFHPAGGLHHARRDRAGGFCIFNDLGVALERAAGHRGSYRRVAYVDIDAHHGDGVMYGFYDSGRVLDIDLHQDGRTLFPGTGSVEETGRGDGAGLKANLPLPPGSGDRTFAYAFLRVVPTLLRSYRPELIVLQHGVDGRSGDRLARLRYSPATFLLALKTLLGLAEELCEGRIVVTGGGGYTARNVARDLARCGFQLAGRPPPTGALPTRWREEYERLVGGRAPARWDPVTDRQAAAERAGSVDRIVRKLGKSLGVRFPKLPVPKPAPPPMKRIP